MIKGYKGEKKVNTIKWEIQGEMVKMRRKEKGEKGIKKTSKLPVMISRKGKQREREKKSVLSWSVKKLKRSL